MSVCAATLLSVRPKAKPSHQQRSQVKWDSAQSAAADSTIIHHHYNFSFSLSLSLSLSLLCSLSFALSPSRPSPSPRHSIGAVILTPRCTRQLKHRHCSLSDCCHCSSPSLPTFCGCAPASEVDRTASSASVDNHSIYSTRAVSPTPTLGDEHDVRWGALDLRPQ
jgi:hypothetical protein